MHAHPLGNPSPSHLRASDSLGVGIGYEGVLKEAVLNGALEIVVHAARLGEEALDAGRCGRATQQQTPPQKLAATRHMTRQLFFY